MNYEREKGKVKKRKKILAAAIGAFVLGLCLFSFFVPPVTWKYYVALPKVSARADGELRIHFLNAGDGDCMVLELPDGKSLMIDGGEDEFSATALRYLNALKIKKLDSLLLTHTDTDHCGGLDKVVKYKSADKIYLHDVTNFYVNADYAELYAEVLKSGAEILRSHRYVELADDDSEYQLTVLSPLSAGNDSAYDVVNDGSTKSEDIDDTSAVLYLSYGGVNALFMGDATSRVEEILIDHYKNNFFDNIGVELANIDILKVGDHGSDSSTSGAFVKFLGVKTAVITCGEENGASSTVCDNLEEAGAEIFRTDRQGNIVVTISADGSYRTEYEFLA
jgi:competence protein ComEC